MRAILVYVMQEDLLHSSREAWWDLCGTMICAVIITDHNIIACPVVAHLHVMILQDVPEQECQYSVGFFQVKLNDVLRDESDECQSEVSMGGMGGKESQCMFYSQRGI